MTGRSLRIYLADGSPNGIRLAEIINWTGQALTCPRSRISELGSWDEARRPGVYFLVASGSGPDLSDVYIGESEQVLSRLGSHVRELDFWNEVVIFTSKDANLTKAHGRFLERRLIELAAASGRASLRNANAGQAGDLPRPDVDSMEEYLANLRIVMAALGHRFLEPLPVATAAGAGAATTPIRLRFEFLGLFATGYTNDDGFVLEAGSQIARETVPSLPRHVRAQRELILELELAVDRGQHFELTSQMQMTSSSTAASLVSGSNRSGPASWRDASGRTLQEIEASAVAELPSADADD